MTPHILTFELLTTRRQLLCHRLQVDTLQSHLIGTRQNILESIVGNEAEIEQTCIMLATALRKMTNSHLELAGLRRELNTLTYISMIPDEVLEEIFFQCLCKHLRRRSVMPFECRDCKIQDAQRVLRVIGKVCSHWKMLVERLPRLWTNVPTEAGRRKLEYALSHSKPMPLYVQLDVLRFARGWRGERRRDAIRTVRTVLKRLHRIEDLTLDNWTDFVESSLAKYQTYQAPNIRRLMVTSRLHFRELYCEPNHQFTYVLSHPCPSLEVLGLRGFTPSSIRPSMVPSLRELYFQGPRNVQILDDILQLLQNLPQLCSLYVNAPYISRHTAATGDDNDHWQDDDNDVGEDEDEHEDEAEHEDEDEREDEDDSDEDENANTNVPHYVFSSDQTAVLPNLLSLTLVDAAAHLLSQMEIPVANVVLDQAGSISDYDARDTEERRCALVSRQLATYFARTAKGESKTIYIRPMGDPEDEYYSSYSRKIEFEVFMPPGSSTESRTVCVKLVVCSREGNKPSPTPMLRQPFSASWLFDVRKFALLTSERDSEDLGLADVDGWEEAIHLMPQLEVVEVAGEAAGMAFFDALDTERSVVALVWPVRRLKKVVLRPSLTAEDSDIREGSIPYSKALSFAIRCRKTYELGPEEVEIDCGGTLPESIFASVTPHVRRLAFKDARQPSDVVQDCGGDEGKSDCEVEPVDEVKQIDEVMPIDEVIPIHEDKSIDEDIVNNDKPIDEDKALNSDRSFVEDQPVVEDEPVDQDEPVDEDELAYADEYSDGSEDDRYKYPDYPISKSELEDLHRIFSGDKQRIASASEAAAKEDLLIEHILREYGEANDGPDAKERGDEENPADPDEDALTSESESDDGLLSSEYYSTLR